MRETLARQLAMRSCCATEMVLSRAGGPGLLAADGASGADRRFGSKIGSSGTACLNRTTASSRKATYA